MLPFFEELFLLLYLKHGEHSLIHCFGYLQTSFPRPPLSDTVCWFTLDSKGSPPLPCRHLHSLSSTVLTPTLSQLIGPVLNKICSGYWSRFSNNQPSPPRGPMYFSYRGFILSSDPNKKLLPLLFPLSRAGEGNTQKKSHAGSSPTGFITLGVTSRLGLP